MNQQAYTLVNINIEILFIRSSMNTSMNILWGAMYYIMLAVFAAHTARLKLWGRYVAGIFIFLAALFSGMVFLAGDEGGSAAFGVIFVHGMVFCLFIFCHAVRWVRIVTPYIRKQMLLMPEK